MLQDEVNLPRIKKRNIDLQKEPVKALPIDIKKEPPLTQTNANIINNFDLTEFSSSYFMLLFLRYLLVFVILLLLLREEMFTGFNGVISLVILFFLF